MIDLSNNNGAVNFAVVKHTAHQNRVYLKLSEGATFHDPTFSPRAAAAHRAGLLVGAYHFARPSVHTPREEAQFFLRLAPELVPGRSLRHCLDLEDPNVKFPFSRLAGWTKEFLDLVHRHVRWHAILYGSPGYLERVNFSRVPGYLWLAAYGRNDGLEHPFTIPHPWSRRNTIAHQYASVARVPGCSDPVDLSRVLIYHKIDVTRLHRH